MPRVTPAERENRPEAYGRLAPGRRWIVRLFWLVPLTFYLFTVSRTPGWVDAPLVAKVTHGLELSVWVNNHNLFTLVGHTWLWLAPTGLDPHHALNVLCALLGALTVFVVFRIGLRLTRSPVASAIGALALMVSHSLWWHSTMLEVYTLSTALLALVVLFVLRYEQERDFRNLCAATFLFGLACANHPQMGLLLLGFLALLAFPGERTRLVRAKPFGALLLCFFVGFQVYLWVFVREFAEHRQANPDGDTLTIVRVMLDRASGGDFKQYMFPAGLSFSERLFWWGFYVGFFVYNFPFPWLLFAPLGWFAWVQGGGHRTTLAFLSAALVGQIIWSANYLVWDMYAFSLPAYVLTGVLITMGVDWAIRRSVASRRIAYAMTPTLLLIPVLYANVPDWIAQSEPATRTLSRLPQYTQATAFWDPLDYFFNPDKRNYDRVQRYADTILAELEPDACFWGSEATMLYPLEYYYQDVLGKRDDVSYHLVFGIVGREGQFKHLAAAMEQQLDRGCPVYFSSLGFPERNVLNYVYQRFDGRKDLAGIRRLPTAAFMETFPEYNLDRVVIDAANGVNIFRLNRR